MKFNSGNTQAENCITTVLLLAAGSGSRLLPLTKESPKCLTLVNEVSILARLVENLASQGIKKLVIVTGHLNGSIEEFLGHTYKTIAIEYLHSPLYKTTNNIYSLWMAREIMDEPFILIESDLVFESSLLSEMIYPDRMAVAGIKDWMNGTTVTINKDNKILGFKKDTTFCKAATKYKTVNIYSFSLASWSLIAERLDKHIQENKVNGYYETVFSELVDEDLLSFDAVFFDEKAWYEIDTVKDLTEAMKLFPIKSLIVEINNSEPSYSIG
ncbi:phosphocholine cytidylyltransferase family protein [Seonamhaeicola maritimus]|uniref:Phosphocholine cytidylyltransferase family protein n=1 Tax=Seonamhaeicola maritimus TaxID=2591822 RepID=A0A5C7GER6_9FLAO|nr:phosphocholine cytidylyltransferase family protein [Seonamhaeicola maritimus]TXG35178.1 phosphocholine cytidylyltransferase family protein [Seonamhaeicola maritimus]